MDVSIRYIINPLWKYPSLFAINPSSFFLNNKVESKDINKVKIAREDNKPVEWG